MVENGLQEREHELKRLDQDGFGVNFMGFWGVQRAGSGFEGLEWDFVGIRHRQPNQKHTGGLQTCVGYVACHPCMYDACLVTHSEG